jgi:hypothetical protein
MGGPGVDCIGAGACPQPPTPHPSGERPWLPAGLPTKREQGGVSCIHKGGIGSTMIP